MTAAAVFLLSCYGLSLSLAFSPYSTSWTTYAGHGCCGNHRAPMTTTTARRRPSGNSTHTISRCLFSPEHAASATNRAPSDSAKPSDSSKGNQGKGGLKGSWGSWGKVVSQREEQEEVLKKIHYNSDASLASSKLRVRTGLKSDMAAVSHLCVDTFRGPYEWYMLPLQLFQVARGVSCACSLVLFQFVLH